jgi:hypothetical protein
MSDMFVVVFRMLFFFLGLVSFCCFVLKEEVERREGKLID